MADNLQKRPGKGILKNSSSFDKQEAHRPSKETKWDEMNIIATLHPADKDYGHMKIDEPKTPYNYDEPDAGHDGLDPDVLAQKLMSNERPPKVLEESDEEEPEDEEDMSPERKALKKEFEMKRKAHYNEYYAVKLARKLLEKEEEDEEEDEEEQRKKKQGKASKQHGGNGASTSAQK